VRAGGRERASHRFGLLRPPWDDASLIEQLNHLNTVAVADLNANYTEDWAFNLTNTTTYYDGMCRHCKQQHDLTKQEALTDDQIQFYVFVGWLLLIVEILILHFLRHRHKLIYHFHGADKISNMPILLSKLDKHFERNHQRGKRRLDGNPKAEETITVHHDGDGLTDSDDDEDEVANMLSREPSQDDVRSIIPPDAAELIVLRAVCLAFSASVRACACLPLRRDVGVPLWGLADTCV
jgi:hypothetical protein